MEWYYAENTTRTGPVTDEQLRDLAASGRVLPTTLVWRQGMANWQPYAQAIPSTPSIGAPSNMGRCVECGKTFSTNDMVHYANSWVCAACKPIFFQRVLEGAAPPTSVMVWRSGPVLVMNKGASLPDRCVKCNAPANGYTLKRNLSWHSPYLYLLIVLNLLIYAIVAVIVRKKAQVKIGLCDSHRSKRRLAIALGWLLGLGGLVGLIAGVANESGLVALAGFAALIAGIVFGTRASVISAKKIDGDVVWIKGPCRPYLDTLPEWSGGS